MNKILRLAFLLFATLTYAQVSAQTYSHTMAQGEIKAEGDITLSDVVWNLSCEWSNGSYFGWDSNSTAKGIQIGSGSKPARTITLKTSGFEGTITSVTVNASTAKDATATFKVTVGGNASEDIPLTSTSTDYTFTPNAKGELAIIYSQPSTSKALYIKSISVTYITSGDVVIAPTIEGTTPFIGSTTVTIKADAGNSIYYTTDGTAPTNASKAYEGPFTLNTSATVKAIAYKGSSSSIVTTKEFAAAYNASDIADFKAQVDGTVQNLTLNNAKVLYADETNKYVYVKDETGAICFYNAGLGLTTGDVLNGSVAGALSIFNNLPEFVANSLTNKDKLTQSTGTPEEPIAATVSDLLGDKYLCNLVKISGVKLDSVDSNLYAYQGDAQIQIYDQFKKLTGVEIVKGNENNIVTGILVVYKTTYELYPITVDGIVTTAITNLKADSAKAQAPVYNLAGQRVDAAYKGVVIQNGKKFIQR